MYEEKPSLPISHQAKTSTMNLSSRDLKKLSSLMWNQDELLNKKRRWLMGPLAISMSDCNKKKSKRPKFLTDDRLTESYVRSDEVSYENVRANVEKSFGAFSDSQREHHVVQDYLQFFETLNTESYSTNPSYFLGNLYSMMNVLGNKALCLVANLVTDKKVRFEKTRPRMKKIIKDSLPKVLEESSYRDSLTPMKELSQIFRDPSNFQKKKLALLTPVSPSLLSSIRKALEELDEMPFQDLIAMNRKLRDVTVIPQFPPARLGVKRDVLLERVKNRCQKVLSTLKEGADLPKPFARALSIVHLSFKQKSRCVGIMTSEFYPFSPETVGLQNDILGALWCLPKVRIHELKALQPLVDPKAKVPSRAFRFALRKYLIEYFFHCDVIDIPGEVLSILASLNRRSRRRLQLFSAGMIDEDVEATLNISSQLKQIVSYLLPDDIIDDKSEALGSDNNSESDDFNLAENSYCSYPDGCEQGSCLNDEAEGTGDSSFASCTPMTTNPGHSLPLTDSYMISFGKNQPILEQDDSVHIITDQSYSLQLTEACAVGDFIKKLPQLEQDTYLNSSQHYPKHASLTSDSIKISNLEGDDRNPPKHCPEQASMTSDFIKKSNMDPGDDTKLSQHCPEQGLGTADMREILIQEICDDTSLVAYRLIGHMLDKFLHTEGRETNDMTRYYLRGGSSLDSPVVDDSLNTSKELMGTKILIQSMQELLPNMPKSLERVKKLMG